MSLSGVVQSRRLRFASRFFAAKKWLFGVHTPHHDFSAAAAGQSQKACQAGDLSNASQTRAQRKAWAKGRGSSRCGFGLDCALCGSFAPGLENAALHVLRELCEPVPMPPGRTHRSWRGAGRRRSRSPACPHPPPFLVIAALVAAATTNRGKGVSRPHLWHRGLVGFEPTNSYEFALQKI